MVNCGINITVIGYNNEREEKKESKENPMIHVTFQDITVFNSWSQFSLFFAFSISSQHSLYKVNYICKTLHTPIERVMQIIFPSFPHLLFLIIETWSV